MSSIAMARSWQVRNHAQAPVGGNRAVVAAVLIGSVLVLCVAGYAIAALRRRQVLRFGVTATAVIEEITSQRVIAGGEAVRADLSLILPLPDGTDLATYTTAVFPTEDLPEPGWTVLVRYWPSNPHRIAVDMAATPMD
jgi:hypothetical protein